MWLDAPLSLTPSGEGVSKQDWFALAARSLRDCDAVVLVYDLTNDPDELHNLATDAAHAADLTRLRAALDEWMKANHDDGLATDVAFRAKPRPKAATNSAGD